MKIFLCLFWLLENKSDSTKSQADCFKNCQTYTSKHMKFNGKPIIYACILKLQFKLICISMILQWCNVVKQLTSTPLPPAPHHTKNKTTHTQNKTKEVKLLYQNAKFHQEFYIIHSDDEIFLLPMIDGSGQKDNNTLVLLLGEHSLFPPVSC